MPSFQHEALVQLFRNEPGLAVRLLERALGWRVPAHGEVRLEDATLTQVVPTQYAADAVVELCGEDGPVHGIVVEVQMREDGQKPYSWPVYAVALRARMRCPVSVLVVAPDARVASWARRPIDLGFGSAYQPLVVGPDAVPRVTSRADASECPSSTLARTDRINDWIRCFSVWRLTADRASSNGVPAADNVAIWRVIRARS